MANLVFDIPRTLISLLQVQGQYEKPELGRVESILKLSRPGFGRPACGGPGGYLIYFV